MKIAAVIPAHKPRVDNGLLTRAVASVCAQTYPAAQISIAVDTEHRGAWHTRQRALDAVGDDIDYVAFLDSDDEWLPNHLELHAQWAAKHGADFVYAWFQVVPAHRRDPFPPWFVTEPWDPARPRHTTMTVMVRTQLAKKVGFAEPPPDNLVGNEDWVFAQGCIEAGAKIVHIPNERTWLYHWDPPDGNTSGLASRW